MAGSLFPDLETTTFLCERDSPACNAPRNVQQISRKKLHAVETTSDAAFRTKNMPTPGRVAALAKSFELQNQTALPPGAPDKAKSVLGIPAKQPPPPVLPKPVSLSVQNPLPPSTQPQEKPTNSSVGKTMPYTGGVSLQDEEDDVFNDELLDNPFEDPDNLILDSSPLKGRSLNSSLNSSSPLKTLAPSVSTSISATIVTATTTKREKIMLEIIETEKSYLKDLTSVEQAYLKTVDPSLVLSATDVKTIFINIPDLILFSSKFLSELQLKPENFPLILSANIDAMNTIYCDYCKRHDASVARIVELTKAANQHPETLTYLKAAAVELSKHTNSPPDLGSMLLKPVQRVLKYPLFLNELLKQTPPEHPEHKLIKDLVSRMAGVAKNINEVKRRKDAVDKVLTGKQPRSLQHGINKTLYRHTQQLKQATGLTNIEPTVDPIYNELEDRFESYLENLKDLKRNFTSFADACFIYAEASDRLGAIWEDLDVFDKDMPEHSRPAALVKITNWRALIEEMIYEKKEFGVGVSRPFILGLQAYLRTNFAEPIDKCMELFAHPHTIIRKRNKKIVDYDRVRDLTAGGEHVDATLLASSKEFELLNTQLLEELPKFLKLIQKFVLALLAKWCEIASEGWWRSTVMSLAKIALDFESRLAFADETSIQSIYSICRTWEISREFESFRLASKMDNMIEVLSIFDHGLGSRTLDGGSKAKKSKHTRERSQSHVQYHVNVNSDSNLSAPAIASLRDSEMRSKSASNLHADLIDFGDADVWNTTTTPVGAKSASIPSVARETSFGEFAFAPSIVVQVDATVDKQTSSSKLRRPAAEGPTEPPAKALFGNVPIFHCIGIYPYNGAGRCQLVFGPGIEFEVLLEDGNWYWARNKRTNEIGWVPSRHCSRI